MVPRCLAPLLAFALVAPLALADTAEEVAPLGALSFADHSGGVLVAWVPGETLAEAYRVYGLNPGQAPTLLREEGQAASASVPAGFERYAVAGMRGGAESGLVFAHSIEGTCYGFVQVELLPEPGLVVCKLGPLAKFRSLP